VAIATEKNTIYIVSPVDWMSSFIMSDTFDHLHFKAKIF
jgi:hypothetical protein